MKIQGIYYIKNLVNSKLYIGSAINIQIRWNIHKSDLRLNKHINYPLQNSWNKYGENVFEFCIIEEVEDKNKLLEREQWWMNLTNCCNQKVGYNLNPTAGSPFGRVITAATREKMSKAKKGKLLTEEQKASRRGWKHTEENKLKFKKTWLGKKHTEESRERMSQSMKGKKKRPMSDAHKNAISIGNSGKIRSKEHNEKLAASKRGKPRSEETKAKIRLAALKQWEKIRYQNAAK